MRIISTAKQINLKELGNQIEQVYKTLFQVTFRVPNPPLPIHGKEDHCVPNTRSLVCCVSEK